jgi:hypothetical protein
VYDDPDDDFIREPFIARFRADSVLAAAAEFTLVAVHVQPKAAVAEIDHLVDVHQFVSEHFYFISEPEGTGHKFVHKSELIIPIQSAFLTVPVLHRNCLLLVHLSQLLWKQLTGAS